MVPFAGYEMPVQYPAGIMQEHLHTRKAAGLFDVSHMGQVFLQGESNIREQCEMIVPGDVRDLVPGAMRYSFLLDEHGGILDDLMITRPVEGADNTLFLVVNAGCKEHDLIHIKNHLPGVETTMLDDRSLLALQGPYAASVLARFCDAPAKLKFMRAGKFEVKEAGTCYISRSGYTGEDGFEISVPSDAAEQFARRLLEQPEVMPVGLGARDSLRLEAGLCLYGHDLDTNTSPVDADLMWAVAKRRRSEGGFIGAAHVQGQLASGATRKRVGIKPAGKAIAREQTEIFDQRQGRIGVVTSGGFGPSVNGPICMGYVQTAFAKPGTEVFLKVRGNDLPARVVALPFVQHRYFRGT